MKYQSLQSSYNVITGSSFGLVETPIYIMGVDFAGTSEEYSCLTLLEDNGEVVFVRHSTPMKLKEESFRSLIQILARRFNAFVPKGWLTKPNPYEVKININDRFTAKAEAILKHLPDFLKDEKKTDKSE